MTRSRGSSRPNMPRSSGSPTSSPVTAAWRRTSSPMRCGDVPAVEVGEGRRSRGLSAARGRQPDPRSFPSQHDTPQIRAVRATERVTRRQRHWRRRPRRGAHRIARAPGRPACGRVRGSSKDRIRSRHRGDAGRLRRHRQVASRRGLDRLRAGSPKSNEEKRDGRHADTRRVARVRRRGTRSARALGPDPTAHHPTPPAADRCDGPRGRRGADDRRGCRDVGDDEQ